MKQTFQHQISKGTRFNQIYIPKDMNEIFQVGDLVEITLLKKHIQLHYSKNLKKISKFKENLIKDIFFFLSKYKEINQIFIFGSFLTEEIDYNDIDILLLSNKEIEEEIHKKLIKNIKLKFHIISTKKEKLNETLKICPLTRSMFYYFISNKPFTVRRDIRIEKNHIRYLLMLPEDLLKVELESKTYYDSLRRLISIEYFLKGKEIAPNKIDIILKDLINKQKLEFLKNNEILDSDIIGEVKKIIKIKLNIIYKLLENGKKR